MFWSPALEAFTYCQLGGERITYSRCWSQLVAGMLPAPRWGSRSLSLVAPALGWAEAGWQQVGVSPIMVKGEPKPNSPRLGK